MKQKDFKMKEYSKNIHKISFILIYYFIKNNLKFVLQSETKNTHFILSAK